MDGGLTGGSAADARRVLATLGAQVANGAGAVLEVSRSVAPTPPRSQEAQLVEGAQWQRRSVGADDGRRVGAFLDGRQVSRVIGYLGFSPVVFATVGAVVRARTERLLHTWPSGVSRASAVYASRVAVGEARWQGLQQAGFRVTDTANADEGDANGDHPLAHVDRAYHCVQRDREQLEGALAARWCATEQEALYLDGGIAKREDVATSPRVVGVVKSHRTLYATGASLGVVWDLQPGERTSAFLITSTRRTPVLSWYLRLRPSEGRGPLWGLVRLEAALQDNELPTQQTDRADALSRMVLAETVPVSLPDARWSVLAYGVRDCEQYLTAVLPD